MDGRPMSIPELLLVLAMLQFSNRDHKSRISFLGWKVPYKNTMKQKKLPQCYLLYMAAITDYLPFGFY